MSTEPTNSSTSAAATSPGVDISTEYEHSCKVAVNFVMQYYTMMHSNPSQLHRFYVADSAYVHGGNESGKCLPALGQKQIQDKVDSLRFLNVHTSIKQIDSLPALGNGILIQVTGELSTSDSSMRAFVQSFVLSQDGPKKYSIVADIFRYQEDGDSNDEEVEPDYTGDAQTADSIQPSENGDVTSQEVAPPDTASEPAVVPSVPAGSQPINTQTMAAVSAQAEWSLDSEEIPEVSALSIHNGPECAGENFPTESADTEETQTTPAVPTDDWKDYPESADPESHQERTAELAERETGETGGRASSSYAFVSSIHTPQTGAKMTEQKFQSRTVYPPKKKPVTGAAPRSVREPRPPGPPTGGYRPSDRQRGFEAPNRPPRDSFQIFVGGLPKECQSEELRECFGAHATVMDVRINPSGFGFVGFASEEEVGRIIGMGDRFFKIGSNFIRVERKGSSGVKKRDGQRGAAQPRYL